MNGEKPKKEKDMKSMFGWSLPPGCTHRQIEEAAGTFAVCDHCGLGFDDCLCDDLLEAKADMATERATRNALSCDSEAFEEMVRDDLAGKS